MMRKEKLAVDGGQRAVQSWPPRRLFTQAEKNAVARLFDHCIRTGEVFGYNGPEEEAYCREFAEFLGGGYADAVNSGTSAIYVALRALEIPAFSEVICPPITDPGGVMPVALCNLVPIVADSEPDSYNISSRSIAERITARTRAILVAHIAGVPADMTPILRIARAHNLPVIEDCAQAHGATYRGRPVGTFGTFGCFSTMSGKHHATGAQGGVVFTRNKALYWRCRRYSDRGKPFALKSGHGNAVASLNLNLNDLSACIGRVQLRKLPRIMHARRRSAQWLAEACKTHLQSVRLWEGPPRSEPVPWFLVGHLDLDRLRVDKNTFVKALQAEGVPCGASYLHLFTEHDWYRNRAVFHGTAYPWTSPLYKGDPDAEYPVPNVRAADARSILISWHERVTVSIARQVFRALRKAETAYLK